ncbi:hypothetical protein L3Q82_006620 [Scortum barcoo]|uniref:Uncharacterized protein n=1 Tax=Scortum barcoo TaxID=214431 RepID=A0ACB8WZU5_9TELE|nr:hypothetical protein L3Q82_006620 [Scortum barcoo]
MRVWGPGAFAKGCSEFGLYDRSRSLVRIASSQDLQHVLERFAAECEAAGMRISTSKSKAMVLDDRKRVACPLRVGGEVLPQVEEFKCLGVLFTSEGKMEREIDSKRIGAASAVMRLCTGPSCSEEGAESKGEALDALPVNLPPTLTYGHELWVMTERTRSRIQAAEMSFLRRVAGRSLRDRVRSSVTREELGVEPLLLHIERSQLRWLGHLFRMPPGRLPREVFQACPTGRRPRGRPRTRWRDYVSWLAWRKCLGHHILLHDFLPTTEILVSSLLGAAEDLDEDGAGISRSLTGKTLQRCRKSSGLCRGFLCKEADVESCWIYFLRYCSGLKKVLRTLKGFCQLWDLDVNMDGSDDYIWQRRIHHGVRYQKNPVPFPESVKIGLEFNAALERKEKLDLCLLTNAVMLELCDFAKTVTKSESYFLFELLEFNFDLGVDPDNDMQCYSYARRIHNKVKQLKEQIRPKSHRLKDTYPLPDLKSLEGFAGLEQSGRFYLKKNKIVDSSFLTDGSKNSQSAENQKSEDANGALIIKKPGGVRVKLTDDVYPFCKELGVTLNVRLDDAPKQKLDPTLVTNGVMIELLEFSRVLCGTYTGIIYDLVKQNFGYEFNKMQFRMQINKLMERKYACLTAEGRDALLKEPYSFQTRKQEVNQKKRKNTDTDEQEVEGQTTPSKRKETLKDEDSGEKEMCPGNDLSYMCPVDLETAMQSGTEDGPEKKIFESSSAAEAKSTVSLNVKEEEEEVSLSPAQRQINGHDCHVLRPKNTTLTELSDLFSEDKNDDITVKTQKQKLWMRRAPRSKQILKSSRVNDMFARCREIGLDFNVGSGNKQNLDLQLLTNYVLWEVYKFACAMTKSLGSFLFDMLDSNFNLFLQDQVHQRNFVFYILTKVKVLQNHPARQKTEFLNSPFQFPDVYNTVDATGDFQTGQEVETEQQTNGDSAASATNQPADMETHPFCKKLGLNLWSTEGRSASQKLDLTLLTTGAMLEIYSFVRELYGEIRETVNDILEHNFDLDLQSGATEASKVIQRWYTTQRSLMKRQTSSPKIVRWLNMVVPVNGQLIDNDLEDLDTEDVKPSRAMEAFNGNVKQVFSYPLCKEIGLDLNVRSKSTTKAKLDLGVLTRGVLFEMHQYVKQNCQRYVPCLYEILEYNFDLRSQNFRKVDFAWSIASQVIAIAGKHGRKGGYLNKVFELPFEVPESSQIVCKEEPEDGFGDPDLNDNLDVTFVRELIPVDIEVEIE